MLTLNSYYVYGERLAAALQLLAEYSTAAGASACSGTIGPCMMQMR
jgi:hypothetical protein